MVLDDAVKEAMSAVMDGEANSMDLARVLRAVRNQPEARQYWQRLQVTSAVLKTGQTPMAIDISEAVLEAIEQVPAKRRVGPLGSMAVAASVTFALVFGGQLLQNQDPELPLATVPGVVVPIQGAAPVQASYGVGMPATSSVANGAARVVPNPAVDNLYDRLAREHFLRFGRQHAEQSAGIQPNASIAHARVPGEKPGD
jgi:sigma-E factor negative regulatory protein RseA